MLKKVIFIPVGSHEYHGDLLPPNTDSIIASRVAKDLSEQIKNSRLLPTMNYGVSLEHADYESTVTVDSSSYLSFMSKLFDSISADDSLIVIINGHGGNVNILGVLESEYNYKHSNSKVFVSSIFNNKMKLVCEDLFGEFDSHAGSVESSLLSYYGQIDKDDVTLQNEAFIKKMPSSLHYFRMKQVNEAGVIKDTSNLVINSRLGNKLNKAIVEELKSQINSLLKDINKVIG